MKFNIQTTTKIFLKNPNWTKTGKEYRAFYMKT